MSEQRSDLGRIKTIIWLIVGTLFMYFLHIFRKISNIFNIF